VKRQIIEDGTGPGDRKFGVERHPRAASIVPEGVGNDERLGETRDPEGDHVEPGPTIVESSLHGRPRQDVPALEAAQGLERAHLDRGLDDGVELEMELARRRCPAGYLGQGQPCGLGEVLLVFVHVGGEQKELAVFHGEAF
jgi:hypothetical protein